MDNETTIDILIREAGSSSALTDDFETDDFVLIGSELSTGQHAALTSMLMLSSVISISCSIRIILMTRSKWKLNTSYYRCMAGLSLSDVLFSLGCIGQPFLITAEAVSWPYAFGTTDTCSMVGFFLTTFGISTAFYNCLLSLTFLWMVCFDWKTDRIKSWEKVGHAVAWIVPLASRIPVVATGGINPSSLARICADAMSPPGCSLEEGTCERGLDFNLHSTIFFAEVLIPSVVGISATVWVYCAYKGQIRTNGRHSFTGQLEQERKKLLRRVAYRAVFYSLAYFNTFAWPLVNRILSDNTEESTVGLFVFNIISYLFYPLQGFFNYLIYTRHDMRELSKKYEEENWIQISWRVWIGETEDRSGIRTSAQGHRKGNRASSRFGNSSRLTKTPTEEFRSGARSSGDGAGQSNGGNYQSHGGLGSFRDAKNLEEENQDEEKAGKE